MIVGVSLHDTQRFPSNFWLNRLKKVLCQFLNVFRQFLNI